MLNWCSKFQEQNLPDLEAMLQEKCKQVSEVHGYTKFKGSNGWLVKFWKRNNITYKSNGEYASVNGETVNNYITKILHIIANYDECYLFNINETELFFRVLPDKTNT